MARSIWTGSISFGLVNIPVKIFSAIREHDIHFHQLAPDGSRVHYKRVSEKTGREVEYADIRKGYETSKGKYVVFEPDELGKMAPASTKTIDIEDFVPLEDIDPIFFERTYHVVPANDAAAKAYALLAAVMEERQRIGIGHFVMRERQHLAAVRPFGKGLALTTMYFADEVAPQSEIPGVPSRRPSLSPREKKLAVQIVDSLDGDWDPTRYHDTYEEELHRVIKVKKKGGVVETEKEPESAKVLDLMEALRASLDGSPRRSRGTKRSAKSTSKRRAPAAKRAKKTASKSTAKRARKTSRKTSGRRSA
jgi:DNA end-binding protein Ku